MVLVFLLLVAAITIPFFETARHYAFVARNVASETRRDISIEGALLIAAQRYLELASRPNARIPVSVVCRSEGRFDTVAFRFQDHAGLIDLNRASRELLEVGFGALGMDSASAGRLAEAVERYRSPLSPGARVETDEIVPTGLKHALFEQREELLDFVPLRGVARETLGEVFTVHSGLGTLNRRFASARLRAHLARTQRGVGAVEDLVGQPITALTLDGVFLGSGDGLAATAVFKPDAAKSLVRRDGPVDVTAASRSPEAGDPSTCRRFFDAGSLALLAEVTR